jgi:hypothetical protein
MRLIKGTTIFWDTRNKCIRNIYDYEARTQPSKNALITVTLGKNFMPPFCITMKIKSYYIDRTEITNEEFNTRMAGFGIARNENSGEPVRFVTPEEIALFCNERSKEQHLDTVYFYNSLRIDTNNNLPNGIHSILLEQFRVDYTRKGFMLPDEVEWEYAYRALSPAPFFWGGHEYAVSISASDKIEISKYAVWSGSFPRKPHQVRSTIANGWGIYDMAGNVQELCKNGIVKGGSFLSPPAELSAYWKTSGTSCRKEELGFRTILPAN